MYVTAVRRAQTRKGHIVLAHRFAEELAGRLVMSEGVSTPVLVEFFSTFEAAGTQVDIAAGQAFVPIAGDG